MKIKPHLAIIVVIYAMSLSWATADELNAKDFNAKIEIILRESQALKPGISTRKDVLKLYEYQGGIDEPVGGNLFRYRGCPYITVRVDFKNVSDKNSDKDERGKNLKDLISTISKPYLNYPIID